MIKKEMGCERNSDIGNALAVVENGFSRSGNFGGSSEETLRTYKRRKCKKMNSSQDKVLENGNVIMDAFRLFPEKTSKSSCSNTDSCEQVFLDIVKSKEFTQLCEILQEDFQGTKVESLRDIHCIELKMKGGAYGNSPMLFHSDMQKVWENLQKVGTDIVSLSKSLMDMSKASFSQQFSESKMDPKLEETEACDVSNSLTCQNCGEKAEGKNSLICESCEDMYHVSCIKPPIEEMPTKSWYCTKCIATGIESPHDNCIACDKLIATNGLCNYEIEVHKGGNICNICKTEVLSCSKFKICGHQKVGIGTVSLLNSLMDKSKASCSQQFSETNLGPKLEETEDCVVPNSCTCWHCGEKAESNSSLICDSCEKMYHVSCIEPPIEETPTKNWYCKNCIDIGLESPRENCIASVKVIDTNGFSNHEIELQEGGDTRKCDLGIQKIAKARREYEMIENKRRTRGEKGKRNV